MWRRRCRWCFSRGFLGAGGFQRGIDPSIFQGAAGGERAGGYLRTQPQLGARRSCPKVEEVD
jgi:hypothetical protein